MLKTVIIWDWDNTLIDAFYAIHLSLLETCQFYNQKPVTKQETLEIIGTTGKLFWSHRFGIAKAVDYYWQRYCANSNLVKPFQCAESILQFCKDKGFQSVVVSNKKGDVLRQECNQLKWNKYFYGLVGEQDTPYNKPSKEIADFVLKNINYNQLIVVGDGLSDMCLAKNLVATAVFVRKEKACAREFKGIPIDFDCRNLSEVREVLNQLIPDS